MVLCCAVLLVPIHFSFSPPSLEDTFISKLIKARSIHLQSKMDYLHGSRDINLKNLNPNQLEKLLAQLMVRLKEWAILMAVYSKRAGYSKRADAILKESMKAHC